MVRAPVWNASAPKTVLVIASRFPPVASVGAIRIRKFVKYLGEFGWKPIVITGAAPQGGADPDDTPRAADESSLFDLPEGLPIHRLSHQVDEWPHHLSRSFGNRLASWTRWFGLDEERWKDGLCWRFERLHDRCSFPDRGSWRLLSAVRLGLRMHRRYRFDAIFSSGMPFSDHLIGLALRRLLRKPWLADFRDPWAEYIHWPQWRTGWGRRLTWCSEAAVVRSSSFVVSVNESMTKRFASRYAKESADKFVTVANGFDPMDFNHFADDDSQTDTASCFRLVYVGSLYETRSPENVLAAFRRFIQTVPGSRKHARFEFIGRAGEHLDKLTNPQDGDTVRYRGMLPYPLALDALARADLNVVMLPNIRGSENDTTTKIYECLGSGRPILAAVPLQGAAARVLCPFDGVTLCDPADVSGMSSAITDHYRRWLAGTVLTSRSEGQLAPLTRRQQTKELAAYLDSSILSSRISGGLIQ